MSISVRSFAKVNLGLKIGRPRDDGFHELRTVYQTIALADVVRVEAGRGLGIDVHCKDSRVPADESNTCYRMAEKVLRALKTRSKVRISIDKRLPVQGGLGGASSNAVATMLGMEKVLGRELPAGERLRLATEVGSDVPLFLVGGTVLGVGRGEQVYPLEDLPSFHCVVATPAIGVSTPQAFTDWDSRERHRSHPADSELTRQGASDRMEVFSHSVFEWLSGSNFSPTGVPSKGWDRAEALLLDLVRTGIENDFESVVFPRYPAIREVKRALERSGSSYVSLSGSGSSVYGLFSDKGAAARAAGSLNESGIPALATVTLPRVKYWKEIFNIR